MLSDALCKIFFGRVDYSHIEIMYVGFRKSDRTVTCAKPFLFSCFRYAAFLIAMSSCCFQINGFLSLKLFNNEILSFMCACLFLVFSLSSTLWGSGVLPFLKKKKKRIRPTSTIPSLSVHNSTFFFVLTTPLLGLYSINRFIWGRINRPADRYTVMGRIWIWTRYNIRQNRKCALSALARKGIILGNKNLKNMLN